MNRDEFVKQIVRAAPPGKILANPGGGTSTIISQSDRSVYYRRGNSTIGLSYAVMLELWNEFADERVCSRILRLHLPSVFDSKSNGHSCNCTFRFTLLEAAGLASDIAGRGTRGSPFSAEMCRA